ncbi:MAG: hypothetical protein GX904_04640, partial [Acholeplasmataceae bacterium]|nr:hypothetical protein [Acholeplasmataceae bacterium]
MKERIIKLLKRKDYPPASIKKIQKDLKEKDRNKISLALQSLLEEDRIVASESGKYMLLDGKNFLTGVLDLKPAGYGFLVTEDLAEDIYIA